MDQKIHREDGTHISYELKENDSPILWMIFSGLGYTYRNPLLYYMKNMCLNLKHNYLGFDCRYYENDVFLKDDESITSYIENDKLLMLDFLNKIINTRNIEKTIWIGKSLGTSMIRTCLKMKRIDGNSPLILITPNSEWSSFIPELLEVENPILLCGSRGDKLYNVDNLEDIYKKVNLSLCEFEYGDHSIEVGNTIKNIENIKRVMLMMEDFVTKLGIKQDI